jgi:hypothetical protein
MTTSDGLAFSRNAREPRPRTSGAGADCVNARPDIESLAALMGHEFRAITERRHIHLFDKHRTGEAVRRAMALCAPLPSLELFAA